MARIRKVGGPHVFRVARMLKRNASAYIAVSASTVLYLPFYSKLIEVC